jgi:hypothetical protein
MPIMKKITLKSLAFAAAFSMLLTSCDSEEPGNQEEPKESKYVLMTMSENTLTKPGYITLFDEIPTGNISNINDNSTQGMGMGGWRPYKNWMLKLFKTSDNAKGVERLKIENGKVISDNFLSGDNTTNGTGNFVIANETLGYYWDGASPLKIQTFNPTTLSRTGEIDLTAAVNERGTTEAGILFRSVGQKFLAVKNGKLFANVTYAKTNAAQKGFWDDFFPDVYIAVIDIATGRYEKTTKIEGTGAIAYINDNEMYSFDTNGDLYIVTQGTSPSGIGGKSKIARIKAAETEVDKTWELKMDDIMTGGKFVTVYATNGKLITTIPNTALTGGPTGNINFSEVWDYYVIDVASKSRTKISGVPSVTNPGAAYGTIKVDDKLLLRVNAPTQNINGYYQLNSALTSATSLFNVTEGGSVSGFYKIEL